MRKGWWIFMSVYVIASNMETGIKVVLLALVNKAAKRSPRGNQGANA